MKTKINLKKVAAAALVTLSFSTLTFSCKKDDVKVKVEDQPKTITEIVVDNSSFSVLKSALVKADLTDVFNEDGSYTVFAPNNDAFAAAGISESDISSLSLTALNDILFYHVLDSKVTAANVPAGPNAPVETMGGNLVYVTKNSQGVFINGAQVINPDIMASNGVIHGIERVLLPPAGNIVEVAMANKDLEYLVAAVIRADEGTLNLISILTSVDGLTVFAPTNQAFINAGFATIEDIQAADPEDLATILTYHVVGARAFSSDLVDGDKLTTESGGTITVDLKNQASLKGDGNDNLSNISVANIMAKNGVIHVIDSVLLP